jgi:hypothetical protein
MNKWNDEYKLIEFFGVLPDKEEDEWMSFSIEKDGLRLVVSFFNYASDVHIAIFRESIKEPIFSTLIENFAGMEFLKYPNGWECLDIAAPHLNIELEEQWISPIGARIKINPHINVEMYQSKSR